MVTSIKDVEISHVARYLFAVPYIKEDDKVLDACCGVGYGTKFLSDMTNATHIQGFDKSQEAIDVANENFHAKNITYYCYPFEILESFTSLFDVITCFEAIEHVEQPELLLKKLSDALKPEGTLIISSPNQTFMPWSAERFPEHKRHFTYSEMRDMLESVGLRIDQTYSQQNKFISCINGGMMGKFMILVCKKL